MVRKTVELTDYEAYLRLKYKSDAKAADGRCEIVAELVTFAQEFHSRHADEPAPDAAPPPPMTSSSESDSSQVRLSSSGCDVFTALLSLGRAECAEEAGHGEHRGREL